MITKIILEIDNVVNELKSKDNTQSFDVAQLIEFELIFFLTLDIVRYEMLTNGKLSDLTSEAISQLFTFQCFEFYYRDFPEIFSKTGSLFSSLSPYNEKLMNYDLKGIVGTKATNWKSYFEKSLSILFKN